MKQGVKAWGLLGFAVLGVALAIAPLVDEILPWDSVPFSRHMTRWALFGLFIWRLPAVDTPDALAAGSAWWVGLCGGLAAFQAATDASRPLIFALLALAAAPAAFGIWWSLRRPALPRE